MTKEQLFEKLNYEKGDKVHVIILRKDGVIQRVNYGFNAYEILGMAKIIEHDVYKIFDGELEVDVEKISRTVLEDEENDDD